LKKTGYSLVNRKFRVIDHNQKSFVDFLFLIVALVISACDGISDKIVDLPNDNYTVLKVECPDELLLTSAKGNLIYSIKIDNPSAVKNIYSRIVSAASEESVFSGILLKDNGDLQNYGDTKKDDGIFTAKVEFDTSIVSGRYFVEFFVQTINLSEMKVAVSGFNFDNGKNNLPPVISNLIMPDSIARNVSFVFSVKVSDPNGLKQVKSVYFQLFRPDGSQVVDNNNNPNLLMQDNGNEDIFGDLFAGDGVFSFKNSFSATAQTGKWTFKFRAIDYANALSNEIIHELLVVE